MTELEPRLNDEATQKVLARALELQAQAAGMLTVSQVRSIAAELGIAESAVDQALAEHRAGAGADLPVSSTTVAAPKQRWLARGLVTSLSVLGLLMVLFIFMSFFIRAGRGP